ncbi:MAG: septum formation protein Maf [Actinobacteria bacterium]|nr:septum formation protein Maf [Actinomycetota bacterium]MTA63137.1 septum formation protein Maf [Actinomycetota bacterium]
MPPYNCLAGQRSWSQVDESIPVVLASASPRRFELLNRIGILPTVAAADLDESQRDGEPPEQYVARIALEKALRVAPNFLDSAVLAADTAVVLNHKVFGKPANQTEAKAMLEELAGRTHCVMTAVAVIAPTPQHPAQQTPRTQYVTLETAQVTMIAADPSELDWYVSTLEPMDKAGSYAVQGMGAALVERVEGDPTTVIGLPLRASIRLLHLAGVHWP